MPNFPLRLFRQILGVLPLTMAPASAAIPAGPGSLAGIWLNATIRGAGQTEARPRAIRDADGNVPPLQPWAAKLREQRLSDADDKGKIFANTITQCLPGGIPEMLWGAAYPVQILEMPGQITELFDEQNHFRVIRLNARHQPDPDPSYMGDSVGHWEGGTLVVDTIGLKENTTLDMVGTPHTEKLHVVERYRRSAAGVIDIDVTIDDPGAFTKPWHIQDQWKLAPPSMGMPEYVCENTREVPGQNGNAAGLGANQ